MSSDIDPIDTHKPVMEEKSAHNKWHDHDPNRFPDVGSTNLHDHTGLVTFQDNHDPEAHTFEALPSSTTEAMDDDALRSGLSDRMEISEDEEQKLDEDEVMTYETGVSPSDDRRYGTNHRHKSRPANEPPQRASKNVNPVQTQAPVFEELKVDDSSYLTENLDLKYYGKCAGFGLFVAIFILTNFVLGGASKTCEFIHQVDSIVQKHQQSLAEGYRDIQVDIPEGRLPPENPDADNLSVLNIPLPGVPVAVAPASNQSAEEARSALSALVGVLGGALGTGVPPIPVPVVGPVTPSKVEVEGSVAAKKLDEDEVAGASKFRCKQCKRVFAHKGNLTVHLRSHNQDKRFQCRHPGCDKRFVKKQNLENHGRTHTGDKPFVCTQCSRGFSQRSNLNRHARTHTGYKPFECEICNKRYVDKRSLDSHMNKLHDVREVSKLRVSKQKLKKKRAKSTKKEAKGKYGSTFSTMAQAAVVAATSVVAAKTPAGKKKKARRSKKSSTLPVAKEEKIVAPIDAPSIWSATSPVHSATSPVFSATSPVFSATSPVHSATSPVPSATSPVHFDTSAVHVSTSPVHVATSPEHAATSPVYSATSSVHSATSSVHSAISTVHSATSQVYSATSQMYSSTSPVPSASSPMNSATSPMNFATSPMNSATSPMNVVTSPVSSDTSASSMQVDTPPMQIDISSMYTNTSAVGTTAPSVCFTAPLGGQLTSRMYNVSDSNSMVQQLPPHIVPGVMQTFSNSVSNDQTFLCDPNLTTDFGVQASTVQDWPKYVCATEERELMDTSINANFLKNELLSNGKTSDIDNISDPGLPGLVEMLPEDFSFGSLAPAEFPATCIEDQVPPFRGNECFHFDDSGTSPFSIPDTDFSSSPGFLSSEQEMFQQHPFNHMISM